MDEQQKPTTKSIQLIGFPDSEELRDFAVQAKCKFIDPIYTPKKDNTEIATELGKIMKHYGICEAIITLEKKW